MGWGPWPLTEATSLLRASDHLHQGPKAFVGNFAMGMLFCWQFTRTGRLTPFLVAHFLIDATAFVGYPWAAAMWPALFGLPG